ncbi:TIGR04255 family protein [Candidatus Obscuribacterales bacterium]|nr:TIGR04255 family protein [Candidatus Obscuribacterales bacterium]MBX3151025.1 TIGR04255 family protein [Candidatus Obscuribacterales bacterium]
MTFPESERETYKDNPLKEVICQLRHPAILKLETSSLADFQESFRHEYPVYTETRSQVPAEVARFFPEAFSIAASPVVHEFATKDKLWTIAVCRDFIALTSHKYLSWDDFEKRLNAITSRFVELYKPPYFTRVGLRYVNIIKREQLGLNDVGWHELLNHKIAGELSETDFKGAEFEGIVKQLVIGLDDKHSKIRLQHGFVAEGAQVEKHYLIDSDFYTEQQIEVNDVKKLLKYFNKESGNLFRWCISSKLRLALGPIKPGKVSRNKQTA